MKKSVLFLALLGLAVGTKAQTTINTGPWTEVNTTNTQVTPPGMRVRQITTVSANECWAVVEENPASPGPSTLYMHTTTTGVPGTEFEYGAIGVGNGIEVSNIEGISSTVAIASGYPSTAAATTGGQIVRTTDGGLSWTQTNTATQFNLAAGGFLNFVHMFNATEGVAMGDPVGGYFEIYVTTNGGVSWTRRPSSAIAAAAANEYGLTNSFFAQGNTIWFGTASDIPTNPCRVYKSTDKGMTWTVSSNTAVLGQLSQIAFKDANNGIAAGVTVSGSAVTAVTLVRTSDGGATWQQITPLNGAGTGGGSFFRYAMDAANGYYYSVGQRFPAGTTAGDFGSSYSTDGINWIDMNRSQGYFAFDVIPSGTTGAVGYAGTSSTAAGIGGIWKTNAVLPVRLANRDAALQSSLNVYPNPSASGLFKVELGTLNTAAQLTVFDALGRQVETRALNATAIASKTINLDLSKEKAGVYTMQLRTTAGIATQKLVIE